MRKIEKVRKIEEILDRIYPSPAVPLAHRDSYTLLVAVVLSAQCTDKRVNVVSPQLFARADNPADMARLPVDEIEKIIRPCGLSAGKARSISRLSKQILEKHGGRVPDNFADLEDLPGVGHKTASVVMSQSFGYPAFPVDTHIHRCATRWGLTSGKTVKQTEADLKRLFAPIHWGKLHLQIIYFGREYCKARGHDLARCPICSWTKR